MQMIFNAANQTSLLYSYGLITLNQYDERMTAIMLVSCQIKDEEKQNIAYKALVRQYEDNIKLKK